MNKNRVSSRQPPYRQLPSPHPVTDTHARFAKGANIPNGGKIETEAGKDKEFVEFPTGETKVSPVGQ
ncbi:hypothetical protein JCM6292_2222 [Bacteroides pyogenes JCM 6292]|uniref:Uncharacterized protein n=1 Tax=Bacteroides pyogenes JCM 6292 TaxID=1235809 RepID=W4P808_9BACE|nr:hypothetical protein JCM6292_2222 [Bacteroides pyogenes JCM 6292]